MFALDSDARLIGVNNRYLETLEIGCGSTRFLAGRIPKDRIVVSESGINNKGDLERVLAAGATAALIGTSIMQAENIEEKVRGFVGK